MSKQGANARLIGILALVTLVALVGYSFYAGTRGSSQTTLSEGTDLVANPAAAAQGDMPRATDGVPQLPKKEKGMVTAAVEIVHLSPAARMLAENIQCVCGCKDILSTCFCDETPGSKDMKTYLEQLVSEGKNPTEVMALMEERYGEKVHPGR